MLAAVDCTKETSLAKRFDIGGYPTRKLSHSLYFGLALVSPLPWLFNSVSLQVFKLYKATRYFI